MILLYTILFCIGIAAWTLGLCKPSLKWAKLYRWYGAFLTLFAVIARFHKNPSIAFNWPARIWAALVCGLLLTDLLERRLPSTLRNLSAITCGSLAFVMCLISMIWGCFELGWGCFVVG